MSRFNKPTVSRERTTNLAGGDAFKQSPKVELVSNLVTNFVQDQYYRSAGEGIKAVREMVKSDPLFAAKASIYTRDKFHMRSITHVVAAEVAKLVKGQEWSKRFYERVVMRPDDALEILALYLGEYGKPIPNSLKKGLGGAVTKFDEYQLGKYKGEGKGVSMVDLINLTRPKPTDAINKLMKGELKAPDTWEVGLTQAGQKAETEEEKKELKDSAWEKLILERKIGYFALLRNLRNILTHPNLDVQRVACEMLIDPKLVKGSKVLPFRFDTAFEALSAVPGSQHFLGVIQAALDVSVQNVPKMDGSTVVMLDDSGSMHGYGSKSPAKIGSLFASILVKAWGADLVMFSNYARWLSLNPQDSVMGLRRVIEKDSRPAGTNFIAPFQLIKRARLKYKRIVILSDMQGWMRISRSLYAGDNLPTGVYHEYAEFCGFRPILYSWDLQGYGSLQFPERDVYLMTGFSEHVFTIMSMLEEDKDAMVKEIEAITI